MRRPRGSIAPILLVIVLAVLAGACSGNSFDPTGPCTADGAKPGAYPELEAVIPATFRGGPPKALDSGRTCTREGLATLAGHGVEEVRFAGGTWNTGTDSGVSLAVFSVAKGPALDPAWLMEFYETGAAAGKNVQSVEAGDYSVGGDTAGRRIDVLNGESFQTIVAWPREGRVIVALVGDFIRDIQTRDAHEKVVREAVDAWRITTLAP
jgi:hypothetical protein